LKRIAVCVAARARVTEVGAKPIVAVNVIVRAMLNAGVPVDAVARVRDVNNAAVDDWCDECTLSHPPLFVWRCAST
jgi:hypothetical protein